MTADLRWSWPSTFYSLTTLCFPLPYTLRVPVPPPPLPISPNSSLNSFSFLPLPPVPSLPPSHLLTPTFSLSTCPSFYTLSLPSPPSSSPFLPPSFPIPSFLPLSPLFYVPSLFSVPPSPLSCLSPSFLYLHSLLPPLFDPFPIPRVISTILSGDCGLRVSYTSHPHE